MVPRLAALALLLVLGCGKGLAPGAFEVKSDLKSDSTASQGFVQRAELEGLQPGLTVEGPPGALTEGLRAALAKAEVGAHDAVRVELGARPPDPRESAGTLELDVAIAADFFLPPDLTHLKATIRGPLTYRHGGPAEELGAALGASVAADVVRLLKQNTPAGYPAKEAAVAPATQVRVGNQLACSLHEDGAVRCWGRASQRIQEVPSPVPGLPPAAEVAAGNTRACARLREGGVRCWGSALTERAEDAPAAVCELSGATALALRGEVGCALVQGDEVRCWSLRGRFDDRCGGAPSFAVEGLQAPKALAAGFFTQCALTREGTVSCWKTCVAPDCDEHDMKAAPLPEFGAASALAVGFDPCAIGLDGRTRCKVGRQRFERPTPAGAESLVVAGALACARTPAGSVRCWELARESPERDVEGLPPVVDLAAGSDVFCAVDREGAVYCWGDSPYAVAGAPGRVETPTRLHFAF